MEIFLGQNESKKLTGQLFFFFYGQKYYVRKKQQKVLIFESNLSMELMKRKKRMFGRSTYIG